MRGRGLKSAVFAVFITPSGSPPMRGRGLKYEYWDTNKGAANVAPYSGAWIEISNAFKSNAIFIRRPLCGGVD